MQSKGFPKWYFHQISLYSGSSEYTNKKFQAPNGPDMPYLCTWSGVCKIYW